MEVDRKTYWKLFISTFYLSSFTFGGGYVIVPLMKKKFVDELNWIEEKEMLDMISIAQSSPGAIAVNASIIIGYRIAGVLGSLVTIAGTVLPPLIILSVISLFYTAFRDNVAVNALMRAMRAGVAAVIIDVVINMAHNIIKEKNILSLLIMIAAFIATFFFKVNVIMIILICGGIGVASTYYKLKKEAVKK